MNTRTGRRLRRQGARGMTLVEIMVVIVILGLIAAAVGVAVVPRLNEARQDRVRLDIKNIESALKLYYAKKGNYPDTASGLKALVDQQLFDSMPKDSWDRVDLVNRRRHDRHQPWLLGLARHH